MFCSVHSHKHKQQRKKQGNGEMGADKVELRKKQKSQKERNHVGERGWCRKRAV
jgi:hypothetical protein